MALADLQRALGALVVKGASPAATVAANTDTNRLTAAEAAWLSALADSKGLAITSYIARWWRETKIQMMARLTVAALARAGRAELIARYLDRVAGRTLFFLPEALDFLGFVAAADVPRWLAAIAEFERALLIAREAQPNAAPPPVTVAFPCPPEALLGGILLGGEISSAGDGPTTSVVIDVRLPSLWAVVD
jgi:hypothetical protein